MAGCAAEVVTDPTADWNAQDLYDEAMRAINSGEFQASIKHLQALEARFPFDPYAKQAQLDVAYSYYKFEEYDTALSAIDRFIRLHPREPNIDYALYLRGLINFNRGRGLLNDWFPHDLARHDPTVMQESFDDFSRLVKRYPDSFYAGDAHQRLIFLRNKMAEAEIKAAEYYQQRGTWLGVANRAKAVIEKYPQSIWRNDALRMLIMAYQEMGLTELAADAQRVLDLNEVASVRGVADRQKQAPTSLLDRLIRSD